MDTYEAIRLLGLEAFLGTAADDDKSHYPQHQKYTKKDVEKCFRQQALKHHPDKGGDPGQFQRLHKAKDILLNHDDDDHYPFWNPSNSYSYTNSTAASTSLYQHRTCIRQVLVMGTAVVAATDDGLVVMETKDTSLYGGGGLERVLSFTTTHRNDDSFLCCCCCCSEDSHKVRRLYAGAKDGVVHTIALSTTHAMERTHGSWQLPTRARIVAISAVGNWVGMATANGGIYLYKHDSDRDNGSSTSARATRPTLVWKYPPRETSATAWENNNMTPETILLEEGSSSSNSLRVWVGGSCSSSDNDSENDNGTATGRLILWELDTQDDLLEEYTFGDEMDYGLWCDSDSDSDSDSYNESDSDASDDSEEERRKERNCYVPLVNITIDEGPVFALAKHKRTVAVASGSSILVWDCINDISSNSTNSNSSNWSRTKLAPRTTLHTHNQTLYAVCLNGKFLAAAGSGEAIRVWDSQAPWTLLHYLTLPRHPAGCCLATNCLLTLDWWGEDSARLVSGGYDGVVTVWTLAHRLEEGDDDKGNPIHSDN